jgi:hypothetical protein
LLAQWTPTWNGSPIAPRASSSPTRSSVWWKRFSCPTASVTPAARAASTSARHSARVRASGFSISTHLAAEQLLAERDVGLRRRRDDHRVGSAASSSSAALANARRLESRAASTRRRRIGVGDADDVEPALDAQAGRWPVSAATPASDDSDADRHSGLGHAWSVIRISSKRMPPGERRKATSRVPKPASTRPAA